MFPVNRAFQDHDFLTRPFRDLSSEMSHIGNVHSLLLFVIVHRAAGKSVLWAGQLKLTLGFFRKAIDCCPSDPESLYRYQAEFGLQCSLKRRGNGVRGSQGQLVRRKYQDRKLVGLVVNVYSQSFLPVAELPRAGGDAASSGIGSGKGAVVVEPQP